MAATSPPASALIIGVDPAKLDPALWSVSQEENAAVQAAIEESERRLHQAGYTFDTCLLAHDADFAAVLVPYLVAASWTVVVIGGGIRKPPELLGLFEQVMNLVHRHAPTAAIAFNIRPSDVFEAVQRWAPTE